MNREKLIKILRGVRAGLADKDKGIVECSTSFVFADGQVITYNDEISVRHPLDLGVEGVVLADKLLAFLANARAEDVKMESVGDELLLKCGRAKAGIPLLSQIPVHLSRLKIPQEGWNPLPDGWVDAIRFCLFSASKDMTKPVLTCVRSHGNVVESCDRFRATRITLGQDISGELLIPANEARHLESFAPNEYVVGDAWAHFRNADGATMSCRLLVGEFPGLDSLLDFTQKGKKIEFPPKLQEALGGADAFTDATFESDRQVGVKAKDGKMSIRAEGPEGWYEESIRAKGVRDMEFTIHPGFLGEILKHSVEAKLTENTLLFKGENFIHVVSL